MWISLKLQLSQRITPQGHEGHEGHEDHESSVASLRTSKPCAAQSLCSVPDRHIHTVPNTLVFVIIAKNILVSLYNIIIFHTLKKRFGFGKLLLVLQKTRPGEGGRRGRGRGRRG
ncbi:unnamed protein product [Knipowitschia caucasica]